VSAIDLRDLRVVYRRKGEADRVALDGFSLEADNEMLALLGPNGSGKSTLMGVIAQTIRPESGEVVEPRSRSGLCVVFQTPALDALLTVRENLLIAGALHGIDRATTKARIESISHELGIGDRLHEQVRHLSGGLARRADLARALVPHPSVLLLDEPTTGLDIDARRSFWESMSRVRARLGMTVLLATHLIDEAERAERVLMMREGHRVCLDTPEALRHSLGERVLRISVSDDAELEAVGSWLSGKGLMSHRVDRMLIVPDAGAEYLEGCPAVSAAFTLAPPSLEDVYSIRTHTGGTA
jgi:ABC-2 type transport system ATP-binding protein